MGGVGGWKAGWLALYCGGCLQKVVPYVQKLVLSQVSVEGWVLNADGYGLLDGPGMAVDFIMYYVELFWVHGVACSGAV